MDFSELKKLAQEANDEFPAKEELWSMVCTPTVGLELIAEIARLTADNDRLEDRSLGMNKSWAGERKLTIALRADRDQLKAENEALRKDAARYNYLRNDLSRGGDHDFCIVRKNWKNPSLERILTIDVADEEIDKAMEKEQQS